MNENRFNACCDGCYDGTGCTNNTMTESGGELRTKRQATVNKKSTESSRPNTRIDVLECLVRDLIERIAVMEHERRVRY